MYEKYLSTDDLVEVIIVKKLLQLREQNRNLVKQIEGTRSALKIKDIREWKATDFYNYFCYKYEQYYENDYKVVGSVAVTIKKIEDFITKMGFEKDAYKAFIDLAFCRYFNKINKAHIGHIISPALYMKLTGKIKITVQSYTSNNKNIDEDIEKFERESRDVGVYIAKR